MSLAVAIQAIRRSNRNSSVATLVALNSGFSQRWQSYLSASEETKNYEFYELLNMLEIACGIHYEKSLFGISRKFSRDYVEDVILLIERDADALKRLEGAIHSPTTFEYMKRFRAGMRKRRPQLPDQLGGIN